MTLSEAQHLAEQVTCDYTTQRSGGYAQSVLFCPWTHPVAHQFLLILPPRGSLDPTLSSFPLTMVQGFILFPQWGSSPLSGLLSLISQGPNGFPLAIIIYNIDLNLLFLGLEIIIEGRKFLSYEHNYQIQKRCSKACKRWLWHYYSHRPRVDPAHDASTAY